MSAVSGVSAGGSYAYDLARVQAATQHAAAKPPAASDRDHDGDTDAPGRVDVKA